MDFGTVITIIVVIILAYIGWKLINALINFLYSFTDKNLLKQKELELKERELRLKEENLYRNNKEGKK
jgi:hypothetical protein